MNTFRGLHYLLEGGKAARESERGREGKKGGKKERGFKGWKRGKAGMNWVKEERKGDGKGNREGKMETWVR